MEELQNMSKMTRQDNGDGSIILNPTEELDTFMEGLQKEEEYDYIKPSHYQLWEGMVPFELHRRLLEPEEYIGFLKGNILKYKLRLGTKPSEPIDRDLEKIKVYQEELKNYLKGRELPF